MNRALLRLRLALFSAGAVWLSSSSSLLATEYPTQLPATTDRTAPFSLVGQVYFTSGRTDYLGSATVIRPSSILTAGHNVYDPTGGWSTNFEFRRATYGSSTLSSQYASHLYVLAGYQQTVRAYGQNSLHSFAYDTAGATFAKPAANGGAAGYSSAPPLLTSSYYRIGVGYGAEKPHTGLYPLYVTPTTSFKSVYGSFWESNSIYFEGGMSGGPLFSKDSTGRYYVSGVIVAGSTKPVGGGIRVIDAASASFIATYLK